MNSQAPEWKPVCGFEEFYEVSSVGEVRSRDRVTHLERSGKLQNAVFKGKILKQNKTSSGYLSVSFSRDGVRKTLMTHRVVCEAFNGSKKEGLVVAHNDGDKLNNVPSNLRWTTYSENEQDKKLHGRWKAGFGRRGTQ